MAQRRLDLSFGQLIPHHRGHRKHRHQNRLHPQQLLSVTSPRHTHNPPDSWPEVLSALRSIRSKTATNVRRLRRDIQTLATKKTEGVRVSLKLIRDFVGKHFTQAKPKTKDICKNNLDLAPGHEASHKSHKLPQSASHLSRAQSTRRLLSFRREKKPVLGGRSISRPVLVNSTVFFEDEEKHTAELNLIIPETPELSSYTSEDDSSRTIGSGTSLKADSIEPPNDGISNVQETFKRARSLRHRKAVVVDELFPYGDPLCCRTLKSPYAFGVIGARFRQEQHNVDISPTPRNRKATLASVEKDYSQLSGRMPLQPAHSRHPSISKTAPKLLSHQAFRTISDVNENIYSHSFYHYGSDEVDELLGAPSPSLGRIYSPLRHEYIPRQMDTNHTSRNRIMSTGDIFPLNHDVIARAQQINFIRQASLPVHQKPVPEPIDEMLASSFPQRIRGEGGHPCLQSASSSQHSDPVTDDSPLPFVPDQEMSIEEMLDVYSSSIDGRNFRVRMRSGD
jgi:hypothetical protein